MKEITGWAYLDDKFECENINMWEFTPAWNIILLKRKKDLGKFKGKKVKITIEEIKLDSNQ